MNKVAQIGAHGKKQTDKYFGYIFKALFEGHRRDRLRMLEMYGHGFGSTSGNAGL